MEPKIRRKYKAVPVTLSTATASCTTIRWDDVAGGCVLMGTGATSATTLQIWASGSTDGSFGRCYDASGSAADITLSQSTTEPRVYQIPDAPFGAGAIKVVAGQAAATAASCTVLIKS